MEDKDLIPLLYHLNNGDALEIIFVKNDGSDRTMVCTRRAHKIELEELILDEVKERGRISVWDLEVEDWRSFKIDSVLMSEVVDWDFDKY